MKKLKKSMKIMIIILCSWHVNENLIKEIKYDKNVLSIITKRYLDIKCYNKHLLFIDNFLYIILLKV